jgi:hypothetical protein
MNDVWCAFHSVPDTFAHMCAQIMPPTQQQKTAHNTGHHGGGGVFLSSIMLCFLFFLLLVRRRQFLGKKLLVTVGCVVVLAHVCRTVTHLGRDKCNQGEECTNPDGTTFYPTCFKPNPNPLAATVSTLYPSGINIFMDEEKPGQNFLVFNTTFDLKSPQKSCMIQSEIFNLAFGEDEYYYHAESYEPGEVTPFVQIVQIERSNQLLHSFKVQVEVLCWTDPMLNDVVVNNLTAVYRFSQYRDQFECATQ